MKGNPSTTSPHLRLVLPGETPSESPSEAMVATVHRRFFHRLLQGGGAPEVRKSTEHLARYTWTRFADTAIHKLHRACGPRFPQSFLRVLLDIEQRMATTKTSLPALSYKERLLILRYVKAQLELIPSHPCFHRIAEQTGTELVRVTKRIAAEIKGIEDYLSMQDGC